MTEATIDLPAWLSELIERPVAVFGGGASGMAARDLLCEAGAMVDIYDEKSELESLRNFKSSDAARYSFIVSSPGFPFDHDWFAVARTAGLEVIPEMDLGACLWKGPIIAITGTNGKTTLTEFLKEAFGSAGMEAYACGNIGKPLSRLLAEGCNNEAIAICEVSSFQSAGSKRMHADYVLWTNFDEDHLDRHGSMKEYFESKHRLVKLMRGEIFFYRESVLEYARKYGIELPEKGFVKSEDNVARGTAFAELPERNTYLMARELWLAMGLREDQLLEAAMGFRKSPHRMERVHSEDGVSYWDDSKATNFHAVFGALARFEKPVIWIGGGKDKGGDIAGFSERLAPLISSAHMLGETANELCAALREQGVEARVYPSLEEAAVGARSLAKSGDNILLSPGFASLDMFDSYSQRGEAFTKAINRFKAL